MIERAGIQERGCAGGVLHVLYSLRAEGCPRLALELLRHEDTGAVPPGEVAVLDDTRDDLGAEFRTLGCPVHVLGCTRWWHLPLLAWRSWRLLRRRRPNGVICYTIGPHVAIAFAARCLGIPIIVHVGTAPPERYPDVLRKIRVQMRLSRPVVSAFVACSNFVAREIIKAYGLPSSMVTTVPNGVDLCRFLALRTQRKSHAGNDQLRIGMVANLEPSKDHATLLKAIAVLTQWGEAVELVLIGEGSLEAELHELACNLGIERRVRWCGRVDDVVVELAGLQVFAYASQAEEGLGIALVEAMAAGVPVVASDAGAMREVLEGGRLGVLVRPGDPEALAAGILEARSRGQVPPEILARYDIVRTKEGYGALLVAKG